MKLTIYHVDTFTHRIFGGNTAAVVPLDEWIPDQLLLNIAAENNLVGTAFYVPIETGYHIRWFSPVAEMGLCGHATLAAAYVIFNIQNNKEKIILFQSRAGELFVDHNEDWLTLNVAIDHYQIAVPPPALVESLKSIDIIGVYKGKTDYMVVLDSENDVRNLQMDMILLSTIPARGIIFTAPGNEVDFVSRFFAPQSGIDEDHATGSTHTTLISYWADRLSKKQLTAIQVSRREGYLRCGLDGERANIGGQARLYLRGEINIE